MIRWLAGAALTLVLAAGPLPAQTPTSQQQFEQSSAALGAQRWDEALRGFEALETRLAGQPASLAVVRIRKGEALLGLGRDAAAQVALRQGLDAIPATDPALREDRMIGHVLLAEIAERGLDYGEALNHYRAAEPLASDQVEQARVLRGLVQTSMFFDAPAALGYADRFLALAGEGAPDAKRRLAEIRTLKGRVLLNLKRHREAGQELGWATRALGGLTTKVDAADLSARADMALAQLLLGNDEEARKYLAFTGAGRLEEELRFGAGVRPPACGEEGLAPDDVAVVEFSIRSDGSVGRVVPIYASREGGAALAFARAVRGWSWRPDEIKNISPLLRALTRVELRCSTAAERPNPSELLKADAIAALGVAPLPESQDSDALRLRFLQQELARREAASGANGTALLPVLIELGDNAVLSYADRAAHYRRALEIARAASAPPPAVAYLKLGQHATAHAARHADTSEPIDWAPLYAEPAVQATPRAGAAIRLMQGGGLAAREKREEAKTILRQVAAMPGLSAGDPIKVAALLRLSSLELAAGDAEAARANFTATGLTAQQCALIDPGPVKASGKTSFMDFPDEALRWGFEGFVEIEHDILPDGKVVAVRPTIAYPPFVFSRSAARMINRFAYDPSYRPGGAIGCGGNTQRIRFRLPD